jgi:putative hydrolase of the HAD superfamily
MSSWVLFDAVGTVIYPEPSVSKSYVQVGRRFGWQVAEEELPERFAAAMSRWFAPGRETDEVRDYETWRRVVQQVMSELDDDISSNAFQLLWEHFADPAAWRVFPDVLDCWQDLTQRGYRLAIASNFDSRLQKIADGHSEFELVERIFVSSQLGWSKPDPRFYLAIQDALQANGEQPAQFHMVGDDHQNDVEAARGAGLLPIWLRREKSSQSSPLDSIDCLNNLSTALPPTR